MSGRRRGGAHAGVAVLLALGAVRPAGAQQARLGLAVGWVRDAFGGAHRALTLSPSLLWRGGRGTAALAASGSVLGGAGVLGQGAASVDVVVLRGGPFALALEMGGTVLGGADGESIDGRASPRLRLGGGGWAVEAGPQAAGAALRTPGGPARDLFPFERDGSRRTWSTRGAEGAGATAAVRRGPLSLRGEWTTLRAEAGEWQDWTGTVGVALGGSSSLSVTAGARTGTAEEGWWSGAVELPLGPSVSLTVSGGRASTDPLSGRRAASFGSIGLVLHSRRRATAAAPAPPPVRGAWTLRVRAHRGACVEVAGDWNGWRPQPLPERSSGVYAIALHLAPGVHRFLVRVDGEWRVPPGYATEPDDFGRRRALVRVAAG
ncbi:MAG TPA: glycogen-binding domain-containing protein [Longimicrobiaceae bacterium]|nr:glycogen-binding domain-containing protein [Longimicrobiaceae bacterium]